VVTALRACLDRGGVALFGADTVYGLCCDPDNEAAVERLYALKGRPPDKPAAVMWFDLGDALAAMPELGPRTRALFERLLPGGLTFLVPNPEHRFPLACGPDPATLGVRVPEVPALRGLGRPVLQTSANLSGGPDARSLDEVPAEIRSKVKLVLGSGTLPGTPSTVVDLRGYEEGAEPAVVRHGAVPEDVVRAAASG
jgi:L-threonylcarbamoyladenylate synthase